jgi:hypothetical protein
LFCGIQSEYGIKSWENREGVVYTSHPQHQRTFLTVSAERAITLSCRMMAFYGLLFPNEVTNI